MIVVDARAEERAGDGVGRLFILFLVLVGLGFGRLFGLVGGLLVGLGLGVGGGLDDFLDRLAREQPDRFLRRPGRGASDDDQSSAVANPLLEPGDEGLVERAWIPAVGQNQDVVFG